MPRVLLVLVFVLLPLAVVGTLPADFIRGGSFRRGDGPFHVALGSTHVRLFAQWRYVEAKIDSLDHSLSVEKLRKNTTIIDEWAKTVNWAGIDSLVDYIVNNTTIKIIMEVQEGTQWCLPTYTPAGKPADPNVIGKDLYLAYIYRFARAAVKRYKAHVVLWQTENELNEAYLEGIIGQRQFDLWGAWREWDYVTEVLRTLRTAVKDEDPSAPTTMNFHTDVGKKFHDLALLPGYFLDALRDWKDLMDVVSFDAYPNYLISTPCLAKLIGDRIKQIREVVGNEIPVIVMETGMAVDKTHNASAPDDLQFTEERQGSYAQSVIDNVVSSGGNGVMWFGVWESDGMVPPGGYYTDEDAAAMRRVAEAYEDEKAAPLLEWALEDHHIDYLRTRFSDILSQIEDGWGIVRADGSYRPAFETLRSAFH